MSSRILFVMLSSKTLVYHHYLIKMIWFLHLHIIYSLIPFCKRTQFCNKNLIKPNQLGINHVCVIVSHRYASIISAYYYHICVILSYLLDKGCLSKNVSRPNFSFSIIPEAMHLILKSESPPNTLETFLLRHPLLSYPRDTCFFWNN